jgi:AcrR family transcriptional regulator
MARAQAPERATPAQNASSSRAPKPIPVVAPGGVPGGVPGPTVITSTRISPRRAATRQRLLTAASAIFAERGMHGATVEDICEAAGFTRGAFYSNFASKEELFFALLRQEKEQVLDQLERVVGDEGPAPADGGPDMIDHFVQRFLASNPMDRQRHLVHVEFWLHAIRNPEAARELNRNNDEFRGEFALLLQAGLARAGRRLSVTPPDAVTAVMSAFEMAMREMLLRDAADQPDPGLARRTLPLIVRALSEPISP